ncbi:MAG TPA: nicotinamide riboside transporter PnuC [Gemmatimonadaceae bacterium]|nr:nicotinamide riboside transporter PnuC [Gemmatimonadaceae bacterium]
MHIDPIETIAAVFGVISVFLSVRQNIWSWPTAIVNTGMYIFVFFAAKLYADTGLQVIYVVLNAYGWYHWLYGGKNRTELPVSRTSGRVGLLLVGIVIAGTGIIGTVLARTTDAALPYVDAMTTSVSLSAQWMMTRKLLENWIIWVAVDVVYIGVYIYKSLYLTAALYLVFLILSAMGYFQWKASLASRQTSGESLQFQQ